MVTCQIGMKYVSAEIFFTVKFWTKDNRAIFNNGYWFITLRFVYKFLSSETKLFYLTEMLTWDENRL